jgi:stage V sporulation protein AC
MKKDNNTYAKYADKRAAKSPIWLNCIKAFVSGGLICVLGQGLIDLYMLGGLEEETARITSTITLIFLAALLTGLGIFDKIARHTGAGTLVPITGFANSVASPALDDKAEGFIPGLGAKIFIVAGPVILYGVLASVVYGAIYWIVTMFM